MKSPATTEHCPLCSDHSLTDSNCADSLCPACRHTITLLRKRPAGLAEICRLAGISLPGIETGQQPEQELPDVLDAVRYRTSDRERNTWYVSVSELEGQPVEIFASTAFDRDQHLQSRISNLTTITRLISLILRHIFMGERLTLEKTLTQLRRSSRQTNDLPDMLGNVLANYSRQPAMERDGGER